MTPEILAVAETLNLCLPPPPDQERIIDARFAAFVGASAGRHQDHLRRYLADLDGGPVAAGDAVQFDGAVVRCGGATLPEARGRGAYRALVAARWNDALARGTPTLVVQAGSMSRPILERLGFETVAQVHVLVDRLA